MKKKLVWLFLLFGVSFADEPLAYQYGWTDGFRTGYNLKHAKSVQIPAGYWLFLPSENMPVELVGFYIFSAQRLGLKSYFTDKEVIFGVFSRLADANFYRSQLEAKGIQGLQIEKREGRSGFEGNIYVIDRAGEAYTGINGVYYHLQKAIEKAQEIDPTVLNRDLLIKDLQTILSQIEKWKSGEKGYRRVIKTEEDKKQEATPETVKKFLEEK